MQPRCIFPFCYSFAPWNIRQHSVSEVPSFQTLHNLRWKWAFKTVCLKKLQSQQKTAPGKPFPLFKQQNWAPAILALSLGMTVETPLLSIGHVAWGKNPSAGLIHQWEPADWCLITGLAQFAAHLSLELIQELHPLTTLREKPLNLKVRCEWSSKWTEIKILFQCNFQVPFCCFSAHLECCSIY